MWKVIRFVRLLEISCVCTVLASAAFVYSVKYEVDAQMKRASDIERKIAKEKDNISFMRAQWSHLNNPASLQLSAQKHLNLKSMDVHQTAKLSDLPPRVSAHIASIDSVPLPPSLMVLKDIKFSNLE